MIAVDSGIQSTPSFAFKTVVLVLLISLYTSYYFLALPYSGALCIQDLPMEWLLPLNKIMAENKTFENIVIGIGQVFIDSWVVFICILWMWRIKNFRVVMAFGIAFGVRTLLLNIEKFPFTANWVWDSPGFPSIAVPYDKTRDFFYSGHTSVLVVIFFQLRKLSFYKLSYINLFCLIYTVILLLTSQVHYTIDVAGALIFSNYSYQIVVYFLVYVDMAFSFPYWLWTKCSTKCSKKENLNSNLEIERYERMDAAIKQ